MMRKAFAALLLVLPALALTLPGRPDAAAVRAEPAAPAARNVYVAGGLSADDLTVLSVAVASADPSAVLLLDSPKASAHNRDFLAAFGPTEVVAVGAFPQGTEDLVKRLGIRNVAYVEWK